MARKRQSNGGQSAPASVKLLVPLPEDELVAGELELIYAHLAGLLDRVIPREVDSDNHNGDDSPWP
jgi:hypothetical protein